MPSSDQMLGPSIVPSAAAWLGVRRTEFLPLLAMTTFFEAAFSTPSVVKRLSVPAQARSSWSRSASCSSLVCALA